MLTLRSLSEVSQSKANSTYDRSNPQLEGPIKVLVTQCIYSRLHSFTQLFILTAFDMHRFTTLARKHEGTTRESRDATNTIAGYPRGTITRQVCSVSYLVYPGGCNGL